MKKQQTTKQKSHTPTPLSTTVLTEKQLQQVVGGLVPQQLPSNFKQPQPDTTAVE